MADKKILFVAPQNFNRQNFKKSLVMMDYHVDFVSNLQDVFPAISNFSSSVLIHDWSATDPSQARRLHHSWPSSYSGIIRILVVEQIIPSLIAFGNDAGIHKIVSTAEATINLATAIDMVRSSLESNSFRKLMRDITTGQVEYTQEKIDEEVAKAFEQFGHDQSVRLEYGNLMMRQESYGKAEDIALDLTSKDPNNLRANNLLARVMMKTKRWDQATQILQTANSLSPLNGERLLMLGDAFYGSGDLDKAMGYYQEAHELGAKHEDQANCGIGKIKLAQGHVEEALELFKQSASEEEAAGYFNNAAIFSVRNHRYDEAIKLYKTALKALKTNKLKAVVYTNLGLAYKKKQDLTKAEAMIDRALKYDSQYEKAKEQKKFLLKKRAKPQAS